MQVCAVDFVAVAVPDMTAARAFYRDKLGLKELSFSEQWAEYDVGNVTLSIVKFPESTHGNGVTVALAVPDVKAALEEIRTDDLKVIMEPTEFPPCFNAMFEDPFGNVLAFHQRKDGTAG